MFSGIVEKLGTITKVKRDNGAFCLEINVSFEGQLPKIGSSVAVNGCCLSVTACQENRLCFDVVKESLERTCLSELTIGDQVNLERALPYGERVDGHLVQGHVDGTGRIAKREKEPDNSSKLTISAPPTLTRYLVPKGSVAVDGVSLTVVGVSEELFTLAIIPLTAKKTTLGFKNREALVNIEVDLMAKYAEKLHG